MTQQSPRPTSHNESGPRTLKGDIARVRDFLTFDIVDKLKDPKFAVPAALGTLAVGLVLGVTVYDSLSDPRFSDETKSFTFDSSDDSSGQDITNAAEAIDGLNDLQAGIHYIENMPENQTALADGIQDGETISIPVSIEK